MNKFYWFGDSWIVGDELEDKSRAFPYLVSKFFGSQCINCGVSGSSVDSIPLVLNNYIQNLSCHDTVFFGLTSNVRTGILENGQYQTILIGPNYNKYQHPESDTWYKLFDTEEHRVYVYDKTIGLLYHWVRSVGANCYFFNLFTTAEKKVLDIVPENAWLLPRTQCISDHIMYLNGNDTGFVISNDMPHLVYKDWLKHEKFLKKYVHPGYCHPNYVGHSRLADIIQKLLQNKINQ